MLVPIYPPLDGSAAERFPAFARALKACQAEGRSSDFDRVVSDELAWCASFPYLADQRQIYEACVRMLADLARLRWRIVEQGFGVALENPKDLLSGGTREELQQAKQAIRLQLDPIIREHLQQDSVRDFVRKMEKPAGKTKKSIRLLIADGKELLARIAPSLEATGEARVEKLRDAIQPYLQLALESEVDPVTGHSLREVWRYFRYTWSIPQIAVPGRQLLYLVRDRAHPNHPVIGITALNNCPLEMGEARETFIGWHRKSLLSRFAKAAASGPEALRGEVEWLELRIAAALDEIDPTNLVTEDELAHPNEAIISRLLLRGRQFASQREQNLRTLSGAEDNNFDADDAGWSDESAPPVSDEVLRLELKASVDPRMHTARKHLIAKKRAASLARLLQARLTIDRNRNALCTPETALLTLESDGVRSACNIVLEALKARRAAANMLELTTCGAVEPYSNLLGGKLVALLMLSPQVAADYRQQYSDPSIITSQMMNREMYRDNSLVYIGTTSLYAHGSSQYNRLKLPAGIISKDQPELRYHEIGKTTGFGTVQFSPETTKAVDDLMSSKRMFRDVNSVFGEGPSPKLRKVRAGLKELGFDPEKIMQHRQRRLIYGCTLFATACDWLTERSDVLPDYVKDPDKYVDASERIADFWRARWLSARINYQPALEALAANRTWLLSHRLPIKHAM